MLSQGGDLHPVIAGVWPRAIQADYNWLLTDRTLVAEKEDLEIPGTGPVLWPVEHYGGCLAKPLSGDNVQRVISVSCYPPALVEPVLER